MKKTLLLFAILFSALTFAQVPQGISYQAIALNGSGQPVISSNVGLRLSILDNSASGTVLYTETHVKTTNPQGLFNTVIGQGTASFGVFASLNWKTNSKFLKVEMDAAGGTNYALIGTTQLLTVPYAMAAESLILSPGEGLTLTSPNGTPYTLSVNDAGQLSLPTSGAGATMPSTIYMYGTFNGYNASTALLFGNFGTYSMSGTVNFLAGYKYLTAGTEIKFLAQNNSSSPVYGVDPINNVVQNASAYTIPGNGFYYININRYSPSNMMTFAITSIVPTLRRVVGSEATYTNPTYNSGTNTFSFTINGVTTATNTGFTFDIPQPNYANNYNYGDNLADGSIEVNGAPIFFPNVTASPKNFRVDLIINFNGSGTYTITQI